MSLCLFGGLMQEDENERLQRLSVIGYDGQWAIRLRLREWKLIPIMVCVVSDVR